MFGAFKLDNLGSLFLLPLDNQQSIFEQKINSDLNKILTILTNKKKISIFRTLNISLKEFS